MASNTSITRTGRAARAIHRLLPSRWRVAIALAADLGLTVLGLPAWIHLALSVAVHAAVHMVGRRARYREASHQRRNGAVTGRSP